MACNVMKTENGIMFICGEKKFDVCRDCIFCSEFLCDFPVGEEKTCDAKLCPDHAYEVAPNIHYCDGHYKEYKKFEESGGVKRYLENVIPFKKNG